MQHWVLAQARQALSPLPGVQGPPEVDEDVDDEDVDDEDELCPELEVEEVDAPDELEAIGPVVVVPLVEVPAPPVPPGVLPPAAKRELPGVPQPEATTPRARAPRVQPSKSRFMVPPARRETGPGPGVHCQRDVCLPAGEGVRTAMLSAREVGVVAQRELLRNLRSTKGIAMFVLFFLGGMVPAVIRVMVKRWAGEMTEDAARAGFEFVLSQRYKDEAIVKYLAGSPSILYFLFEGTLTFLPLLVLLVGFDQIAGEVQHRTLRYSAGRATRASIVTGKALGIWGVVAVMISVLHLTVWAVAAIQDGGLAGVFSWGGRFLLFSIICAGAYVGFASLMSSLFRTPIVALFVGAGAGFAIWLANGILGYFPSTEKITWIFPNRYERLLIEPLPLTVLGGLALFVAWGAVCVAASSLIVSRRDV